MPEKTRKNKPVIAALGIFCVILLALTIALWFPNRFSPAVKIVPISKGQTFSQVVDSLSAHGVIGNKFLFKAVGKLFGYQSKIRAGKYSFMSGASNIEILRDIAHGLSTVSSTVTIFEGASVRHIFRMLHREVDADSARFYRAMRDTSLLALPSNKARSLEGFLLPETYDFNWQDNEHEIVQRMVFEFRRFFNDSLQRRLKAKKMNLNELMTMASIVEGEAVLDEERPVIAGVYYNRLKRNMRLEADPTIQYLLPNDRHTPRHEDLKIESSYNTYLHYGLPPGPINNPGRKSILAALYPAQHGYLYFVANGSGGHRFARSYAEHRTNVRLYRRTLALAKKN